MSRDRAHQKHLAKAATAAPRRGTYVIVTYATVPRRRKASRVGYDLTSSQLVTILGYRAAPPRGTYVIVTYATVPLETVCRCRAIVRARMQLLQRHVLLGRGVRTVVVGRLVPSKGLLLVRRALDESIESAVPYVELPAGLYLQKVCYWYVEPLMRASNLAVPYAELSAVPHVELQFVRSTGMTLPVKN